MSETTITVKRTEAVYGFGIPMKVWIDGSEAASGIGNGRSVEIKVPNGEHSIRAGTGKADKGNEIAFNASGGELFFVARPRPGVLSTRFALEQVDELTKSEKEVQEAALETVWDSGGKAFKAADGSLLGAGDIAPALERDIKSLEEHMKGLKEKIKETAKSAKNMVETADLLSALGNDEHEINARMKAMRKAGGQRYRRTVSAWSAGGSNWTFVGLVMFAFYVAAILLSSAPGGLIAGIGIVGGGFGAYYVGRYIPVYYNGLKKTNAFLAFFIALVMGFAIFYGMPRFVPAVVKRSIEFFVVSCLLFPTALSFIAVRNKYKTMIIVLSVMALGGIVSSVLLLTLGI